MQKLRFLSWGPIVALVVAASALGIEPAAATTGTAPIFDTAPGTLLFLPGVSSSYFVQVDGSPPPVVTETGALPPGVTFSPDGFSGTPELATPTSYPVVLTANNGVAPSATLNLVLQVQAEALVADVGTDAVSWVGLGSDAVDQTVSLAAAPTAVAAGDNDEGNGNLTAGYVAEANGTVVSVDPEDGFTQTANVGSDPDALVTDPTGEILYVANAGSDDISAINCAPDFGSAPTFPVPGSPTSLAMSDVSGMLYVAGPSDDAVWVVNTATQQVVDTIHTGTPIDTLIAAPGGGTLFGITSGGDAVTVIDTATLTVAATVTVDTGTDALALSPDGSRLYVTSSDGILSTVATSSDQVVATADPGGDPVGVTVSPDGTEALVTQADSSAVDVVDTTDGAVEDAVGIGASTGAIAMVPTWTAPTIEPPSWTTLEVGQNAGIGFTAVGFPTPTFAVTAGTLPAGVTIANDSNGGASLTGTPTLAEVGTYPITLTASNGTGVVSSESVTISVVRPTPTMQVELTGNGTVVSGQSVVASTTLTGDDVALSGTITGTVGGATVCTGKVTGTATTNCTVKEPYGTYSLTLTYSGNATYLPVSSGPLTFNVTGHDPVKMALAVSPLSPEVGMPMTVMATVSSADGTPNGTVSFSESGDPCTDVPLVTGSGTAAASCTFTPTSSGESDITVSYSGTSTYHLLTKTDTLFIFGSTPTTTTVTASPNPVQVSASVVLTATVSAPSGTLTGAVTFRVGSTTPCVETVSGTSPVTATCTAKITTLGTKVITATYGGSAVDYLSTSPAYSEGVLKA